MHGPIGEEHEFSQAYRAHYDEIPQPVETEPRTGIRPQEKGIGCKSRTVRPKVGDLRPQIQQLDDTLRQSQRWARENNGSEWRPCVRAEVGASKINWGC